MKTYVCKVEGCSATQQGRRVCGKHYERYRRNGTYDLLTSEQKAERRAKQHYDPDATVKKCTQCHIVKTMDNFYRRKTKSGEDRPYSHCKECHRDMRIRLWEAGAEERRIAKEARRAEREAALINNGPCSQEGCTTKAKAKGLCARHYYRQYTGIPMDTPTREHRQSYIEGVENLRVCTICDEIKDANAFYKRVTGIPSSVCKECSVCLSRVRQLVNQYNDVEKAYEVANGYEGRLREKALAYVANKAGGNDAQS